MFWIISVYFNIRNTLPKSGTFLLGHPVYIYIYINDDLVEVEKSRKNINGKLFFLILIMQFVGSDTV